MRRRPLILFIESDVYLAEIYARHFADHKFQTKIVKNFFEADKKNKITTPDAIIVDIALEEKVGLEWLENFRKEKKHEAVPVIVLTGLGDRESVLRTLAAGASKYFLKSQITPHELTEQVKKFLLK